MSFDSIVQVSVSEPVAQRLLTMIRAGLLKPGQPLLPARDLASMLGVAALAAYSGSDESAFYHGTVRLIGGCRFN